MQCIEYILKQYNQHCSKYFICLPKSALMIVLDVTLAFNIDKIKTNDKVFQNTFL